MKLFKSKYRVRIESKIVGLENRVCKFRIEQNGINLAKRTDSNYFHLGVVIGELEHQIDLLKNLL